MATLNLTDQLKSRPASLLMGFIDLGLAYFLISKALDTGSILEYFATLVLLVLGIRLIVRSFKSKK